LFLFVALPTIVSWAFFLMLVSDRVARRVTRRNALCEEGNGQPTCLQFFLRVVHFTKVLPVQIGGGGGGGRGGRREGVRARESRKPGLFFL
jgi:hypothetical protein